MESYLSPLVILIQGKPATGKTTIAKVLAEKLEYPYVSKDEIKENLYDNMTDKKSFRVEDSKALGIKSFDILYTLLESLIASGTHVVLDAAWNSDFANKRLNDLATKYPGVRFVQVFCETEETLRMKRFTDRANTSRHEAHLDHVRPPNSANSGCSVLDISGIQIIIDTSTCSKEDAVQQILQHITS